MKTIGQILLWVGFLSGSLATVFNLPSTGVEFVAEKVDQKYAEERRFDYIDVSEIEVPKEGWHLIPWTWYGISAAVCIVGVVMLQQTKKTASQKSEATEANLSEIKTSLDNLIRKIEDLAKSADSIPPSQIVHRIDDQLADDFRTFADGRESITAEHDLNVFADVMTQFAAGERSINRAWSAAADGYIDEAKTCIDRGAKLLREAQMILTIAEKK